ncbi:hypothetical protein [Massilia timonae]|uniref:Baseplate J-like family protein n=1 Tax=Massilia timonae TaxID=47229 RepID=A0A1S2N552_9BURK|nr:hypothetical protein [Massilia timonae]OIJ40226.1 hypothetical protein LO55_3778 [Massilia timonae]
MSMREGLAQHTRLLAALAPHYIDVDELSQAQLMTLALHYAGLVRFATEAPPADWDRTWRDYFGDDETLVMAEILSLRVHRNRAGFDALVDRALDGMAPAGVPAETGGSPIVLLAAMVERLETWSGALLARGSPVGIDLSTLIAGVLENLPPSLRRALAYRAAHPEWNAGRDAPALVAQLSAMLGLAPGGAVRDDELRALCRTWFNQLAKAIEMVQRGAAQRLEQSLSSGVHDPGAGLLLAFVQLYRRAQDAANTLTERHLDFYYDRVLRMRPKPAEVDSTFLVFAPSAPGARAAVPAGAAFLAPAGRQAGDLVFAPREHLTVGDARLRAMFTLFCERNPLTAPENALSEQRHGRTKGYPTACRLASLPVLEPDQALERASLAPRPLFGAPRTATSAAPGQPARLGFALASNVLAMREGERSVHVTLLLGAQRHAAADDETLGGRLARLAVQMRESQAEVRYKVLRRMFTLALTGADGWMAVPAYGATFEPAGAGVQGGVPDALHIHFTLGHEAGAVVPYDPALHGPGVTGACPLLRFELNGEGYLYPYGLLRGLPMVRAQVDVSVRGHRSLALYNQMGALSPAAPFQPFGPLPAHGAWLVVGSAETACKRLTAAELAFEWGGLPQVAGGLRAWYGGYDGEPFRDVRCTVAALADGRWQPVETQVQARPTQVLFADGMASGGRRHAVGACDVVNLGPVLHLARPPAPGRCAPDQPFAWEPGASSGFFRLTLDTGEFAFGHRDYPYQLARVLTRNSQWRYRREPRALPNPPYTPTVETVALHYAATSTIGPTPAASGEALLRLHPFGWEAARGGSEHGDLLLPSIDYSGNLYLGLSASALDAPLTLFFNLVEDALPMSGQHARDISWAYLAGNRWIALPPHAVLGDTTQGFIRPGIVALALPPDAGSDNTIMPPGLVWLRVSCEDELNRFCQLYSVHPHALQVWRAADDMTAGMPERIAAATIRRPRQAIPGLGRVTQMTDSGGGRLPESRVELRRRSAERLRHKGRAIVPDDYERLVLERFPDIDRVKCFPNLSLALRPDGGACPGHVLVVALPAFASSGHLGAPPRLNGDMVARVHAFLAARVGADVRLEVANPFYQRIQVRCKVRLAPGLDHGRHVNLLDRLVSDFISPWRPAGNTSLFGWTLRQHDVEAFLLAQPGVLGVGEFSMLSVSDAGRDRYTLTDTAAPGRKGEPAPDVTPRYPWSVAVPIRRHAILVADSEQSRVAQRTGIGKLEIGSTFIISSETDNDQAK